MVIVPWLLPGQNNGELREGGIPCKENLIWASKFPTFSIEFAHFYQICPMVGGGGGKVIHSTGKKEQKKPWKTHWRLLSLFLDCFLPT